MINNSKFSGKSTLLFSFAAILLSIGYTCMILDMEANGFGVLTLWIAPPLLLAAFALPVMGILGTENIFPLLFLSKLKANKWKHGAGLLALVISFTTYLLTLEPTASLWDCSEFIAAAYKLQVPHTPGTPLSLLLGRVFSMLAFGNVYKVAWAINLMSAFFSALTVYLVYYVTYSFGEKLIPTVLNSRTLLITSSLASSLCLAFSDTFWFSAVEAETYGAACFFMMLLLWLILKGKDLTEPQRSRWLILIAYVTGLSYCIHPMCLLVIPVLPLAWYSVNRALTFKQIVLSVSAGLIIVFLINRVVAIGIVELAFSFDLVFVNSLHLPFYSGIIGLLFFLFGTVFFLLKKFPRHTVYTWSVVFLLLGFIPYLMLFIRSNHNPPIDEANPENLSMIKAYMNRESYPSSPLLFGPYFDAKIDNVRVKKKVYFKSDDKYEVAGTIPEYLYEKSRETFLPRLYSRDAAHIEAYKQWTGLTSNEKPNFFDNLKFMVRYQLGHMCLRYLLWNFAGREGEIQNSSWLKPWENLRTSDDVDRARNQYWTIPFLLGILGGFYHYKRDRKNFFSNAIFFLITGVILATYLNSSPNEPRERDYIYVGSYIAFSIWTGLGILAMRHLWLNGKAQTLFISLISLVIPAWMFYQNFDDHDRSGRTFQIDQARSILNSCAPNSILFTGGDNDTFPLWYLQEVEGFRTDVRVAVLSYFNTDWYINQLRKQYYESTPFNLSLDRNDYRQYGPNDVLYIDDRVKEGIDVTDFLRLLKENHPALTTHANDGDIYHILPSRILKLHIGDKKLIKNTNEATTSADTPNRNMTINVTQNYLEKNVLALLDLIVSNGWERPVYFNYTSMNTIGVDLTPYLVQEGLVFRLSSHETKGETIAIDKQLAYQNLIEKADYSNLSDKSIHLNYEDYFARIIVPLRESFNTLARAYLLDGNNESVEKVLQHALEKLYPEHLPPSFTNINAAALLLSAGKTDLCKQFAVPAFDYYNKRLTATEDAMNESDLYLLKQSAKILHEAGAKGYLGKVEDIERTMVQRH